MAVESDEGNGILIFSHRESEIVGIGEVLSLEVESGCGRSDWLEGVGIEDRALDAQLGDIGNGNGGRGNEALAKLKLVGGGGVEGGF